MAQNGLVPVKIARHGQRFWKRFTSYEFAARRTDCGVVLQELPQAAAAFPIVFQRRNRGFEPRAIFSCSDRWTTPFVSQDGRWLAPYVLSELRCYPFQAEPILGYSGNSAPLFRLKVDEGSGLVSDNPTDEPFFDKNGALSPALLDVKTFLRAREAAKEETLKLCQRLERLGLFERMTSHYGLSLPRGTFGVSTSKIHDLSEAEKLNLLQSRGYFLVHAHQISLSHFAWLERAQQQFDSTRKIGKYTENSDISGFLCAMANAHYDELSQHSGV